MSTLSIAYTHFAKEQSQELSQNKWIIFFHIRLFIHFLYYLIYSNRIFITCSQRRNLVYTFFILFFILSTYIHSFFIILTFTLQTIYLSIFSCLLYLFILKSYFRLPVFSFFIFLNNLSPLLVRISYIIYNPTFPFLVTILYI